MDVLAATHEMLKNVTTDQSGSAYHQHLRDFRLGSQVHLFANARDNLVGLHRLAVGTITKRASAQELRVKIDRFCY